MVCVYPLKVIQYNSYYMAASETPFARAKKSARRAKFLALC